MDEQIKSPLFPVQILNDDTIVRLPPNPNTQSGSVKLYIIVAENNLFVEGFSSDESSLRPPALLRGCLFIRISKPVKIKSLTLKFSGVSRTEWPEGIPPKKTEHSEVNKLIQHTWPFFTHNQNYPTTDTSRNNANIFIPRKGSDDADDIVSLNLDMSLSPMTSVLSLTNLHREESLAPSLSNSLVGVLKRNAGSSSSNGNNSNHNNNNNNNNGSSNSSILNGNSGNNRPGHNLLKSVTSHQDHDLTSTKSNDDGNSNKLFIPGDYIYSFEQPIPSSTPESINATFGSVSYALEADLERSGAFKTSLHSKKTINIVRAPSQESSEESEPIVINRDWEDQLKYEIVVSSKTVILNSYLPIAFKLVPLNKIKIHRIRVYFTEHLEYFCKNKKVHRTEPAKKFLLLEHKPTGDKDSLLDDGNDEISAKEFEFQVYVPEKLGEKHRLHPDASFDDIQSHHWIKLCIRISRHTPTAEDPLKRKHFELSIDSPIHILSPLCAHANTLLPAYNESNFPIHDYQTPMDTPLSPGVEPVGGIGNNNNGFPGFQNPASASIHSALMNLTNSNSTGSSVNGNIRPKLATNISYSGTLTPTASRSHSNSNVNNNSGSNTLTNSMTNLVPVGTNGQIDILMTPKPNMNIESNIYKPSESIPIELKSPQAQPFSPISSPQLRAMSPEIRGGNNAVLSSPLIRPIHLIRKPSIEDIPPPPFKENDESTVIPMPTEVKLPKDHPPSYETVLQDDKRHASEFQELGDIGHDFSFSRLSPHESSMAGGMSVRSRNASPARPMANGTTNSSTAASLSSSSSNKKQSKPKQKLLKQSNNGKSQPQQLNQQHSYKDISSLLSHHSSSSSSSNAIDSTIAKAYKDEDKRSENDSISSVLENATANSSIISAPALVSQPVTAPTIVSATAPILGISDSTATELSTEDSSKKTINPVDPIDSIDPIAPISSSAVPIAIDPTTETNDSDDNIYGPPLNSTTNKEIPLTANKDIPLTTNNTSSSLAHVDHGMSGAFRSGSVSSINSNPNSLISDMSFDRPIKEPLLGTTNSYNSELFLRNGSIATFDHLTSSLLRDREPSLDITSMHFQGRGGQGSISGPSGLNSGSFVENPIWHPFDISNEYHNNYHNSRLNHVHNLSHSNQRNASTDQGINQNYNINQESEGAGLSKTVSFGVEPILSTLNEVTMSDSDDKQNIGSTRTDSDIDPSRTTNIETVSIAGSQLSKDSADVKVSSKSSALAGAASEGFADTI